MRDRTRPVLMIISSAILFGVSAPLSKMLVTDMPATELAGLLYLGAFLGLGLIIGFRKATKRRFWERSSLTRRDIPWLVGAIITGGIAGPILLMTGLTHISGFSASMLLNLEGVFTVLLAVTIFGEVGGKRLFLALTCMTAASAFLSYDPNTGGFRIEGVVLLVGAMLCWGVDNNLTQRISDRDPVQITMLKGLVAGSASIVITIVLGSSLVLNISAMYAIVLGALCYGVSLVLFIKALKGMGSGRAGAFFAFGPFVGAAVSIAVLGEQVQWLMIPAAALMIVGVWALTTEKHEHEHRHTAVTHEHMHEHDDPHHRHVHDEVTGRHTHLHTHVEQVHSHAHWPDTSHRHDH
jgi:drug/metabolite transporter (DMT)-like permease